MPQPAWLIGSVRAAGAVLDPGHVVVKLSHTFNLQQKVDMLDFVRKSSQTPEESFVSIESEATSKSAPSPHPLRAVAVRLCSYALRMAFDAGSAARVPSSCPHHCALLWPQSRSPEMTRAAQWGSPSARASHRRHHRHQPANGSRAPCRPSTRAPSRCACASGGSTKPAKRLAASSVPAALAEWSLHSPPPTST